MTKSKGKLPKPPKKKPKTGPGAKDPNSTSSRTIAARGDRMRPSAKRRRQRFLSRYIIHWNGKRAAIEIGIPERSAAKQASEMLKEPYTSNLLEEFIQKTKEEDLCTRNDVIAGLKKEANYMGGGTAHAARVAAWAKLAKIKGLEKDEEPGGTHVHLHFDEQDESA